MKKMLILVCIITSIVNAWVIEDTFNFTKCTTNDTEIDNYMYCGSVLTCHEQMDHTGACKHFGAIEFEIYSDSRVLLTLKPIFPGHLVNQPSDIPQSQGQLVVITYNQRIEYYCTEGMKVDRTSDNNEEWTIYMNTDTASYNVRVPNMNYCMTEFIDDDFKLPAKLRKKQTLRNYFVGFNLKKLTGIDVKF